MKRKIKPQRTVGIRELKQHFGQYMDVLRRGISVELTYRGEPLATMVPVLQQVRSTVPDTRLK